MREDQVTTATVNIKSLAEQGRTHGRTFDMPTGSTSPPGRFPTRFTGLGRLPESKIHRVTLQLTRSNPRPGLHLFHIAFGKFQVGRKLVDTVINITGRLVGHTLGDQALNQSDDLRYVLGRLRLMGRLTQTQGRHIFIKGLDELFRKRLAGNAAFISTGNNLIVNVRVVTNVSHIIIAVLQVAVNDIENDIGPGVTDMTVIVDRHPTDIHPHLIRYKGLELFFFT